MSQLLAGCFIILQFDPIYVVFIFGFSVCAMLTTKCKVSQDQTGIRARWGGEHNWSPSTPVQRVLSNSSASFRCSCSFRRCSTCCLHKWRHCGCQRAYVIQQKTCCHLCRGCCQRNQPHLTFRSTVEGSAIASRRVQHVFIAVSRPTGPNVQMKMM